MPKKTKLAADLNKMAKAWAAEIQEKANASDKPAHIIVTAKVKINGEDFTINVTAKSPKGDARAYEYGSGIHSRLPNVSPWQEGRKGHIVITPKKGKLLAFHWDTMNQVAELYGMEAVREALQYSHKFRGFAEDGRYLFKFVEHPGVEAANGGKGYIGPAVTQVRAKIRKQLPKAIKDSIQVDVVKKFQKIRMPK